jgi:tetratricopeptide (TPR) repeat protein
LDYSKKININEVNRGGESPLCVIRLIRVITLLLLMLLSACYVHASIRLEDSINDTGSSLDDALFKKYHKPEEPQNFSVDAKRVHDSKIHILHNLLGTRHYRNDRYQKALLEFQAAVNANENFYIAYNNLGLTHLKLSNIDEAKNAFNNAIKCNENYFEAYNNLGSIYLDNGEYDKALELLYKARSLTRINHVVDFNIYLAVKLKEKRERTIRLLLICMAIAAITFLVMRARVRKL